MVLVLKFINDYVPIYNILTKLNRIGICSRCFTNLYLTSKARANLNGKPSNKFPIHSGPCCGESSKILSITH